MGENSKNGWKKWFQPTSGDGRIQGPPAKNQSTQDEHVKLPSELDGHIQVLKRFVENPRPDSPDSAVFHLVVTAAETLNEHRDLLTDAQRAVLRGVRTTFEQNKPTVDQIEEMGKRIPVDTMDAYYRVIVALAAPANNRQQMKSTTPRM